MVRNGSAEGRDLVNSETNSTKASLTEKLSRDSSRPLWINRSNFHISFNR